MKTNDVSHLVYVHDFDGELEIGESYRAIRHGDTSHSAVLSRLPQEEIITADEPAQPMPEGLGEIFIQGFYADTHPNSLPPSQTQRLLNILSG